MFRTDGAGGSSSHLPNISSHCSHTQAPLQTRFIDSSALDIVRRVEMQQQLLQSQQQRLAHLQWHQSNHQHWQHPQRGHHPSPYRRPSASVGSRGSEDPRPAATGAGTNSSVSRPQGAGSNRSTGSSPQQVRVDVTVRQSLAASVDDNAVSTSAGLDRVALSPTSLSN